MAFVNSYKAPPPPVVSEDELYGPDPYDVNFTFPLPPESLQSERVRLTPFIPREYAEEHWKHVGGDPDLLRYYPASWPTLESFLYYEEAYVRRDPGNVALAIIDRTRPDPAHPERGGTYAGIVGLYYTSSANLFTEIAFLVVFPPFQRTHVARNTVGILLRFCLELPSASPPGLGLRRVQWRAHEKNAPSIALAERMGFTNEGIAPHYATEPPTSIEHLLS